MKFFGALLFSALSLSAFAQGRPGPAGGANSGANPGPQDQMVEEFKKRAKECNNLEPKHVSVLQVYEFFRAKELNEIVSGHDHASCESLMPSGEHVTFSIGCYLTDNFKAATRAFLKDRDSLDVIRESKWEVLVFKNNGTVDKKKSKKMDKDEAKAIKDYLEKLVADKK